MTKRKKVGNTFHFTKDCFFSRNADNFSIIVLILNAESARLYESASIDVIVLVWDPAIFYSEQRKSRKIGIMKDGLNRKKECVYSSVISMKEKLTFLKFIKTCRFPVLDISFDFGIWKIPLCVIISLFIASDTP